MLFPSHFLDILDISQVLFLLFQGHVLCFQLLDFLFCPYTFLMELENLVSLFRCALEQRQGTCQDQDQESLIDFVSGLHITAPFRTIVPEAEEPGEKSNLIPGASGC